jgi:hypothetical protein
MATDPDRALLRRHAAAMSIIRDLPPEERGLRLLTRVVCSSAALNAAVDEAEERGLPLPAVRGRGVKLPVSG